MKSNKEPWVMIFVLLIEFFFGIYTTLFIHFPEKATEKELWKFSSGQVVLSVHMILGIIITIGTIALLIRVIKHKLTNQILSTGVATLGVILATVGGVKFIPTQLDIYSLMMILGFVLSLFGYGLGIYRNR